MSSLWQSITRLTRYFRRKPPPPVAPPSLTPAEFLTQQQTALAERIKRVRIGLARQYALPHGKQGDVYQLQATIALLEGDLADLDRLHEDATLAKLKAAIEDIEARRAERKKGT